MCAHWKADDIKQTSSAAACIVPRSVLVVIRYATSVFFLIAVVGDVNANASVTVASLQHVAFSGHHRSTLQ